MGKTILIVDDSRVARKVLRRTFEKSWPEWNLLEAPSGEEAMEMLARNEVDAIILDQHMPGMLGFEVAEEMAVTHPHIVVTMMTADIQQSTRDLAAEIGVGFIAKPPTMDALRAFMEKAELGQQ